MNSLPRELVQLILLFVLDTSRHSLFSVLLVNKALHDLTLPLLYRQFSLVLRDPDFVSLSSNSRSFDSGGQSKPVSASERLNQLLTDEWYSFALWSIQELVLSNPQRHPEPDPVIWTSVSTLISRLKNLQEMTFKCYVQLPLVVLDALHQWHPDAQLHVIDWTRARRDTTVGSPAEEALAHSPCLRSISATFRASRRGVLDFTEAALTRIIGLAPNLTSVHTTREFHSYEIYEYWPSHDDETFQDRETERFLETNAPPNPVKEVDWLSLSRLISLSQVLDLSAIVSLGAAADWQPLPLHMGHTFPSLEHFRLTFDSITSLDSLIATCNPLASLSIVDHHSKIRLGTIASHHGSSLTSLALHQHEDMSRSRPVLSPAELGYLRDNIPNLQNLEIDINRTQSRHQEGEVYRVLVCFRNLASIILHYDTGQHARWRESDIRVNEVYPAISEDFGKSVWRQLCGPDTLRGLKRLTINIGEPHAQTDSLLGAKADYGEGKLVIVPHERDDMVGEPEIVQFLKYNA